MSSAYEAAEALLETERRLRREVDVAMSIAGLSFARGKLLDVIETRGPIRPGEVAVALNQAPRTITTAIDALERDGLVRRDAHPSDRRAHLLTITDRGRVALGQARIPRAQVIERMFGRLDSCEHRQLIALLHKMEVSDGNLP